MRSYCLIFVLLFSLTVFGQMFDDFDSTEVLRFLDEIGEAENEDLYEALSAAGGNWQNLASPIKRLEGVQREDAIWLINTMEHLDRLQMDSLTLIEHIEMSYHIADEFDYGIPDTMFRPYILAYRISYEPVTPWRKRLYDFFYPALKEYDDPRDIASIINIWASDSLEEGDYNFFGGMQSPDMTLSRREGSTGEITAFITAALKAFGIPSRTVYIQAQGQRPGGRAWVEFFDGNDWIPLYPNKPSRLGDKSYIEDGFPHNVTFAFARGGFKIYDVTSDYTDVGYIKASFFIGDNPLPDFSDFTIQVINNGALSPIDYISTRADSTGVFTASIGDGRYYITVGTRDIKGNPSIQMLPIEIFADETTTVSFDVTPPVHMEMAEFESGVWGTVELPDKSGRIRTVNLRDDRPTILYIFHHSGEPSVRMLEIIEDIREGLDAVFFAVSIDDVPNSGRLTPSFRTIFDIDCSLYQPLGYSSCGDLIRELPIVLFFDAASESHFEILSTGYDLNIGTILSARLQMRETD